MHHTCICFYNTAVKKFLENAVYEKMLISAKQVSKFKHSLYVFGYKKAQFPSKLQNFAARSFPNSPLFSTVDQTDFAKIGDKNIHLDIIQYSFLINKHLWHIFHQHIWWQYVENVIIYDMWSHYCILVMMVLSRKMI